MGCVTSKVLTRSSSYQEELKHTLWRSDKGFTVTRNGGDHQFLALICSTTEAVPKICQSANYAPESGKDIRPSIFERVNPSTVNTWELMAGLEEEEAPQKGLDRVEKPIVDAPKRSKSFDWSREHELPVQGSIKEDGNNRGIERSRSFHTVEDYERLLKANECDVEAKNKGNSGEFCVPTDFKDESSEVDVSKEKGSRRKAMAKELTSLKIPSTIEFPAIASLKEWVQVGEQVYSPGACATPKFGSFGFPVSMNKRNKCSEDDSDPDSVFDPELLSAFEEAMQWLQTEEESAIQLIEDEITLPQVEH